MLVRCVSSGGKSIAYMHAEMDDFIILCLFLNGGELQEDGGWLT